MKFFVITILRNRSDLTELTLLSFYQTNTPFVHIFVDNASTDDTDEVVHNFVHDVKDMGLSTTFFYIKNDVNLGIAKPFSDMIMFILNKYGMTDEFVVLKLDNDIIFNSPNLLRSVEQFYSTNGCDMVVAPRDLAIDPAYEPKEVKSKRTVNGFTPKTHVGGACLFLPIRAAKLLAEKVVEKDVNRGAVLRAAGYEVGYIDYLKITHIGLNKSTQDYKF